jgi:hypothetical protein
MAMLPICSRFRELACRETRTITLMGDDVESAGR